MLNLTLSAKYTTRTNISAKVMIRKTVDDRIFDEQGTQIGGGLKDETQYEDIVLASNKDEWSYKIFCYEVTGSSGSNANRINEVTVYIDTSDNSYSDSYYEYYLFDYTNPQ